MAKYPTSTPLNFTDDLFDAMQVASLCQKIQDVHTLIVFTHYVLPQMLQRRKGKILQVASVAAFQPGTLMVFYFATKAYVLHFSEAIAEELRSKGITILNLPKMHKLIRKKCLAKNYLLP